MPEKPAPITMASKFGVGLAMWCLPINVRMADALDPLELSTPRTHDRARDEPGPPS
jgi:hypothetical protein